MAENTSSLDEEKNNSLREEVVHLEQLLKNTRSECDDIGAKYQELSEKMEGVIKYHLEVSEGEDHESEVMQYQKDFRNHIEQEWQKNKNRISSYQQIQKEQSVIIDGLQNRVEEYRSKCARLEAALANYSASQESLGLGPDVSLQNGNNLDHEAVLIRLEQEKNRCQGFSQINKLLREQLETATEVNRALTSDIQHLTEEWQRTRAELEVKETEWQQEGQSFTVYLTKEHHRLMYLWRQVLQFRHEFAKLKSLTERDLSVMRSQLQGAAQTLNNVCNQLRTADLTSVMGDKNGFNHEVQKLNQELFSLKLKCEEEKAALNEKVQELISSMEQKQRMLDEKDRINNALNKTIEKMEGHPGEPGWGSDAVQSSGAHRCCQTLKDIARVVLEDLEHRTWLGVKSRSLSPVRKALISSTPHSVRTLCENYEFIEGTLAAVENSLRKRSMQVEELNLKMVSHTDRIKAQQRIIQNLETDKQNLTQMNGRLSSQLTAAHATVQDFMKDTHKIQTTLEETGTQKLWLEEIRKSLNDQIESLNAENDRLNQTQNNLYSKIEQLQQEKEELKLSEQTVIQDLERSKTKISMLEKQLEESEKQYEITQQKLQELALDKEILEQERDEFSNSLNKLEKHRSDLDAQLAKLQTEGDTLKNKVTSLEKTNESLLQEKTDLTRSISEISAESESAKSKYLIEKTEYEQERKKLKEQIDQLEEKCADVELEKQKAESSLASIEKAKSDIEDERSQVLLENTNLNNSVTKLSNQKLALEEELEQIKKELEKSKEMCEKLSGEKDELARMKAELTVKSELSETELAQVEQVASALKNEKEELEKALYASQQLLNALQDQKQELESDLNHEKARVEFLQDQLSQLKKQREVDMAASALIKDTLSKKIQQNEEEFRAVLQMEREQHKLDMEVLTKEKESQRIRIEAAQGELIQQLQTEQDDLIHKHAEEIATLKKQMTLHEKELQDRLYLSVNEKEQMHMEKECLLKISSLEGIIQDLEKKLQESELKCSSMDEKMSASIEHYQQAIESLETEKSKLKEEVTNFRIEHEKVVKSLEDKLSSMAAEKEEIERELYQVQISLKNSQDEKAKLENKIERYELSAESGKDKGQELEQQIILLQQKLSNEKSECNLLKKSYEDLKERLKKFRTENSELRIELNEAKQRAHVFDHQTVIVQEEELKNLLAEVEEARLLLKDEVYDLRMQVAALEGRHESKDRELAEMHIMMQHTEEAEAELKQEILKLKQKVIEKEASREALQKELNAMRHNFTDVDYKLKIMKEKHKAALQETLAGEQSLVEDRVQLEKTVTEVKNDAQKMRVKLNFAEGKIAALESKISKVEGGKREVENKLHSLNLSLRSTLGLGSDSGFQTGSIPLFSTPHSSRRGSPARLGDTNSSRLKDVSSIQEQSVSRGSPVHQSASVSAMELDVDLVTSALQNVIQKSVTVEKERDDLKVQLKTFQRRLEEVEARHNNNLLTLQAFEQEITSANQESREKHNQLTMVRKTVSNLEAAVFKFQRENLQLSQNNAELSQSVVVLEVEKSNMQAKISELRNSITQLKQENHSLSEARDAAAAKALKTEVIVRELELEKTELQKVLTKKEAELETLEPKLHQLEQSLTTSEQNCNLLRSTIENLTSENEKYKRNEKDFHDQLSGLQRSLSNAQLNTHSVNKELSQLKGQHSSCEREKSTLQSTIDSLRNVIMELKQSNQALRDRIQTVTQDLKDAELRKAELEGQLQGYQSVVSFNEELEKGAAEKLRAMEHEKHLLEEQLSRMKAGITKTEELRIIAERQKQKAEKEKSHLQKLLEKLEKERALTEELANRSVNERSVLGRTLSKLEMEKQMLNNKIQNLQAQLAESEQRHLERLKNLEQQQNLDRQLEIERLRTSKEQLEKILDIRDRNHKQVVSDLEKQISSLKEQLTQHHQFIHELGPNRSASALQLHNISTDSLERTVATSRQLLLKSAGSDTNIARLPSTSAAAISASAPSKVLSQHSAAVHKRQSSTPKARRRLEDSFKLL